MTNYDPDASIQDADIEMAQLNTAAHRERRLKKMGICCHGWYETRPVVKCRDCGKVFKSEDELNWERREALI